MDIQSYFTSQSAMTDPGANAELIAKLPRTVPELCEALQKLCLIYEERYKYPIQNERLLGMNSHDVETILGTMAKLDKKTTLEEGRDVANRFLASSSDFCNLMVGILRSQGTAARKRVGFIPFEGYFRSHDVVEYWADGAWQQVDPTGLAGDGFVPAYQIWIDCREGKRDAKDYHQDDAAGLEVVRNEMLLDLAALNKVELEDWDRYGWMLRPFDDFSDSAWATLDRIAELMADGDAGLEQLHEIYDREEGVQVPRVIHSETPYAPPHKFERKL